VTTILLTPFFRSTFPSISLSFHGSSVIDLVLLIRYDIGDVFDDLVEVKILHGDRRPPNILRAPSSAKLCPTHNRVHRWFFVDWEDALIVHHKPAQAEARSYRSDLATYVKSLPRVWKPKAVTPWYEWVLKGFLQAVFQGLDSIGVLDFLIEALLWYVPIS
jgi:hypothetical protein